MKRLALLGALTIGLAAAPHAAAAADCVPPRVTDSPPAQSVLSTFGILRRDATAADTWPQPDLFPSDATINRLWIRDARSLGSYDFFVIPATEATSCSGPAELFIGALGSPSTVQGGARVGAIKRFGEWIAQGTSRGSIVAGLLPDRVARVTVTFPAGRQHPGGVKYKHRVRKTVRVRNNLALFRLGRPPSDAGSPSHQVWRSKSGRVIRRAPGNP